MNAAPNVGRRYPLRAVLGVTAGCLFVLAELAMLAMWMMPLVPLVPVFILIMFGNAFVLADLVRWAASLERTETVQSKRAAETFRSAPERHAQAQTRSEPV